MTKTRMFLFLLAACALTSCAGMGATETVGAIGVGAGAVVAFMDALAPYLPPEAVADLSQFANRAQGIVDATAHAVGAFAKQTQALQEKVTQMQSQGVSVDEALTGGGLLAGAAVGASRYLSAKKDEKTGRRAPQQPAS